LLFLFHRVAGEAAAKFLENLTVYLAEHYRRMYLTVAQLRQLLQGETAVFIVLGEHREGHQYLIRMQTRILGA
jgi:hypothetical protein